MTKRPQNMATGKTSFSAMAFVFAGVAHAADPVGMVLPPGMASMPAVVSIPLPVIRPVLTPALPISPVNWTAFTPQASSGMVFTQPAITASPIAPASLPGTLASNPSPFVLNLSAAVIPQHTASPAAPSVAGIPGMNQAISALRMEGAVGGNLGIAHTAAGGKETLNIGNGSLLGFSVDKKTVAALESAGHLVQAAGGQVVMSATAINALTLATVNNTGVVEAQSVQISAGRIMLTGDVLPPAAFRP